MIGKIQRVPLREVWKHEALDLTTWLKDNIDVLNEVLDMSLSNTEREQSAGDFSVDLVAEDEDGSLVVIENQLEKSDHDHLGKLITYLTAMEAKKAIWIVKEPRPEHVAAITWLNESSAAAFYLLKIEGIRINDSAPAPLLTLIVGPSEEGREIGEAKKELAERYGLRKRFWTELLNRAKDKTKLHANISPRQYNWVGAASGKRGLGLNYVIRKHEGVVELYIDRGQGAEEETKAIFDSLAQSKETIEKDFGGPLDWQRLEGKRACRIRKVINIGGYRDEAKWQAVQDAMIDAMVRLERALKPHIAKLPL
jgi:uncharacterized protein DUF4268